MRDSETTQARFATQVGGGVGIPLGERPSVTFDANYRKVFKAVGQDPEISFS
jgi:hypothetical protein